MIRYLKRSASVRDRLVVLGLLRIRNTRELTTADIASMSDLTPQRASVILYELANQGHIARRFESQPYRHALFQHIPGYRFEVYQSKSKPRPKQKRKAKAERPLLDKVWRDKGNPHH